MNHRELTANVGANITIDGDNPIMCSPKCLYYEKGYLGGEENFCHLYSIQSHYDRRVVECLVDSGHMSINRDAMYHDGGEQ